LAARWVGRRCAPERRVNGIRGTHPPPARSSPPAAAHGVHGCGVLPRRPASQRAAAGAARARRALGSAGPALGAGGQR